MLGGAVLHFAAAVAPGFGSRHGKRSGRSDLVRQPAAFLDAGIALHFHVPLLPQLGLCVDGHCAGFNADEAAGPRQKDWRGVVHCGAGVLCLVLSRSVRLARADPVGAEHQDFAELRVLLRQLRGVFSAFLKKGLAKNFNYFHELHYIK